MNLHDFRAGLLGALQGASGSGWQLHSGRCLDGLHPFTRTTGVAYWRTCLPSGSGGSGAVAVVGKGRAAGLRRVGIPAFSCSVDVYCAVDETDTLAGIVTFVDSLRRSLDDALSMGGTTYQSPEFLQAGPVTLMRYTMQCDGIGCESPADTATRYLLNILGARIKTSAGIDITLP